MTVKNYSIDPKLKLGKHYPGELTELIRLFNTKGELKRRALKREIELIEGLFKNYASCQSNIQQRSVSLRGYPSMKRVEIVDEAPEVKNGQYDPWGRRIQAVINKVNRKLALLHPQLLKRPLSISFIYYLEPTALRPSVRHITVRDKENTIQYWVWLAKVIEGTDPWIFKQCAYRKCKKVFFSRQQKKYHSECRSKYFSEKAVKDGLAKKRQKAYRERLKKKSKVR